MLIMTTKVDKRKLLIAAAAVIAAIAALLFLGGGDSQPTASITTAPAADTNDARVKFLTDLGWDVTASPAEAAEVKIPKDADEVFDRYNELQKSQGYDLSKYAGKKVMRYVYKINNYPDAKEPVYATLLVYKDKIIGGDITDTTPGGRVRGFGPNS
ncbi:MAG: DUF4830 domain-containing protein [Oscillospiraceae bacterium]|nr:DUF4830 domain-containing protein [Oscillospiraceae bacterium]